MSCYLKWQFLISCTLSFTKEDNKDLISGIKAIIVQSSLKLSQKYLLQAINVKIKKNIP